MTEAFDTGNAQRRRRSSGVRIALGIVAGAVGLVVVLVVLAASFITLRYDGPEPVVEVETTALGMDAYATEGVAVSPDGVLHFADGQGFVYRVNGDDSVEIAHDLREAAAPADVKQHAICQLAFAPSGDLYVAHYAHGVLHRIRPDGTRETMDADLEGPNFVLWHPAGYVFLTDSVANMLYRYDPDGSNRILIADTVGYPNGFAFSPDGRTILLNSCDSGTVYRIRLTDDYLAAGPPEQVRFLGKNIFHKAILDGMLRLPDETYLVCDFFGNQLVRLRADGSPVQRIRLGTTPQGKNIYPASLAQAADGTLYVSNLGNVFTKDWGRGVYRFTLPPL